MCLALPGRIEARMDGPNGLPFGRVRFGAITQDVCLSFVPEAVVGEYVIVHVGFAIQRLDTAEAERTLALAAEPAPSPSRQEARARGVGGSGPEGAS